MIRCNLGTLILLALALLFAAPRAAHAAQSYDNCTGVITSLPAVIVTPGIWCLKQDLSTAVTSGNVIDLQADDVVVDCNGFKLNGSAAGTATQTNGIHTIDHSRETLRHCDIRGFKIGVNLEGSGRGHAVEDNNFDGNTWMGLSITANDAVVRRNRVFNTGGTTLQLHGFGIWTYGTVDILDNTVSGVTARSGGNGNAWGIYAIEDINGSIIGNGVRGLVRDGTGQTYGIQAQSATRVFLRNNDLVGDSNTGSHGLTCGNNGAAKDNVTSGFETGIELCVDGGGNAFRP
jgi:nitrous oxidase accessory protein NosD